MKVLLGTWTGNHRSLGQRSVAIGVVLVGFFCVVLVLLLFFSVHAVDGIFLCTPNCHVTRGLGFARYIGRLAT